MTRFDVESHLRDTARTLSQIDIDVYDRWGKDLMNPSLGGGDHNARVCFFGRDPGRDEVRWGLPFIGAGGQKVEKVCIVRCTMQNCQIFRPLLM